MEDSRVMGRQAAALELRHGYGFDPTNGYRLQDLLRVEAPVEPVGFEEFWKERFDAASRVDPRAVLRDTGVVEGGWRVMDWTYFSTGGVGIRGWALLPCEGKVLRAFLVGHGYAGRDGPDYDLEFGEAALFFPCFRGLSRSRRAGISPESRWHVLHDIHSRQSYVLGGCVEDFWVGVSAILSAFPAVEGRIGCLGISFGAGVGVMATAWDGRVQRAHWNVPTFGNQALRMQLPSVGSAAAVRDFARRCPRVLDVLPYYDAAVAARHVRIPTHCACALFDPMVAPAGQFAIFNALSGPRELFVLTAGHHDYPGQSGEVLELRRNLYNFFADM